MAFRQDRRLPNGWTFEKARARLEEFQKEIEESESLDTVILFIDDDGERDLNFMIEYFGEKYSKTIILAPDNGTGNPGLVFLGDAEFDVDQLTTRLFTRYRPGIEC